MCANKALHSLYFFIGLKKHECIICPKVHYLVFTELMLGITWSAANFSLQVAIKSKIEQDFKKSKTKSPKELHHVFDKVTHPCPAFAGVRELGSYVVGPIYPLACTEGAFDFISF